jgi:hypothetical protein
MTRRDPFSFAVAGGIFGLALYGYIAARLALAAALTALLIDFVARRDRQWAKALGSFAFGIGLVALPLATYWLANPDTFMVRVNELSIVDRVLAGDFEVLLLSAKSHLLMFNVHGDLNARHNLPGVPMLDPWCGAFFVLGVVVAVARIRRPQALLLLSWMAFGLLGGILSGPMEAPQGYRTGMIAPACYLLAGLGLDAVLGIALVIRPRWRTAVGVPLVAAALVASSVATYRRYFHERAESAACWGSMYEAAHAALIAGIGDDLAHRGVAVYLDVGLASGPLQFEVNQILLRREPKLPIHWDRAGRLAEADLANAVLFVAPRDWATLPEALRALPRRVHTNPFGEELFTTVSARQELL